MTPDATQMTEPVLAFKARVLDTVADALIDLHRTTGITPSAIHLDMQTVTVLGGLTQHILADVRITFDL